MATEEELDTLRQLERDLRAAHPTVERYDRYYEGRQPLRYMAKALEAEIGDRVTQVVINFPRLAVEAYDNRLDVDGFRARTKGLQNRIDDWWRAVELEELSQLAVCESLALARSYAIVGSGDDPDNDPAIVTVESPREVITQRDPRTRRTTAALKRWKVKREERAKLYLPDSSIEFERRGRKWEEVERDDHRLGEVPVVPLVNYPRILDPLGRSEFADIIPLADAVNKMATDMMISGEFHAMPRRWMVGMTLADFETQDGGQASSWSAIAGRVWGTDKRPGEVEFGQFPESNLEVFHNTIRLLVRLIGQILALPSNYVDFVTENPPSAEAMRAAEYRTIKRAERKQKTLSGPFRRIVQLADLIMTGRRDRNIDTIETVWRDPATPTRAQAADAAVKLTQADVIPPQQAWVDLGYTVEQQAAFPEMFAEATRWKLEGLTELGVKPTPAGAGDDTGDGDA